MNATSCRLFPLVAARDAGSPRSCLLDHHRPTPSHARHPSRTFPSLIPHARQAILRSFRNADLSIPHVHTQASLVHVHHHPTRMSLSRPWHAHYLSPHALTRTRTSRPILVHNYRPRPISVHNYRPRPISVHNYRHRNRSKEKNRSALGHCCIPHNCRHFPYHKPQTHFTRHVCRHVRRHVRRHVCRHVCRHVTDMCVDMYASKTVFQHCCRCRCA